MVRGPQFEKRWPRARGVLNFYTDFASSIFYGIATTIIDGLSHEEEDTMLVFCIAGRFYYVNSHFKCKMKSFHRMF